MGLSIHPLNPDAVPIFMKQPPPLKPYGAIDWSRLPSRRQAHHNCPCCVQSNIPDSTTVNTVAP
jgi:hypothetical protein